MQSIRKKIAVSASLLMASAGVVASVQTASPATSAPPISARQKATVSVSIVPGIIGPGAGLQKLQEGQLGRDRQVRRRQGGQEGRPPAQVGVDMGDRRQGCGRQEGQRRLRRALPGQQGRDLPGRRPGLRQRAGEHRRLGYGRRLRRRVRRVQAQPGPLEPPPGLLPDRGQARVLEGRPQGRQGLRRLGQAERAGRQEAQRTVQAEEARQERRLRQVQVPPERQHRHPVPALHHLRRGIGPDQVPAAPGPARLVVDAAGEHQRVAQPEGCRHRDRHHRVVRQGRPQRRSDELRLRPRHPAQEDLPWRLGRRRLGQEARPVPREQERRLVQALPRLLRGVEPVGVHLPHRRQGDRPHQQGRLGRAGVPDPEPAQLRLRAGQAAEPGREEEPAPDHGGGLDPHLAGPGITTRRRRRIRRTSEGPVTAR